MSSSEDIACRTKRRYRSRHQAKKALKLLRRRGRRALVIYECWYCEQFHLGNLPGAQTYRRSGSPPLFTEGGFYE